MALLKTYKITVTPANTAFNVLTGTAVAPTFEALAADKGQEATIQNQTAGSIATVGGSDVVSNAGIVLIDKGASQTLRGTGPTSIQVSELWVTSDTNNGVVVVQLRKFV